MAFGLQPTAGMSAASGSLRKSFQHMFFLALYTFVLFYDQVAIALTFHIIARISYVGFVMAALYKQDSERYFTREKGSRLGFEKFKSIASFFMENDAFSFAVLCLITRNTFSASFAQQIVYYTLGVLLIFLGIGIKMWAAKTIKKGYYWWDFFEQSRSLSLRRIGPYRYLKNPMYTVGYAHSYGIALVLMSVPGLLIALFDQIMILILYFLIEKPHFEKTYQ